MTPLTKIARACVTRFLPAAAVGLLAQLIVFVPGDLATFDLGIAQQLATTLGAMSLGFAGLLSAIARRLDPEANILGRRSVLCGAAASTVFFAQIVGGVPSNVAYLLAVAAGAGTGLAMFFPWLSRAKARRISAVSESPALASSLTPADARVADRVYARRDV
jgi:hypothetical protein